MQIEQNQERLLKEVKILYGSVTKAPIFIGLKNGCLCHLYLTVRGLLICDLFQCSYAACYCEENVYKLCEAVRTNAPAAELEKCYAVFVSNKKRVVPLWRQKAGREEERLVIWDYHVVFIYRPDDRTLVYDLDSELPFPTYFHKVGKRKVLLPWKKRKRTKIEPGDNFWDIFWSSF
jgi:hypothetical protein